MKWWWDANLKSPERKETFSIPTSCTQAMSTCYNKQYPEIFAMLASEMGLVYISRRELRAMKGAMREIDIYNEEAFDMDLVMESLAPLFTTLTRPACFYLANTDEAWRIGYLMGQDPCDAMFLTQASREGRPRGFSLL